MDTWIRNAMLNVFFNYLGGNEVFDHILPPINDKNERFNQGYPHVINLDTLKCPCGTSFLSKQSSAICVACGTATCSAECHDKYSQSVNNCLYHVNFVKNEETLKIQGLRNIKLIDLIKAMKLDLPVYSPTSITNSKFMKSMTYKPFEFILQRGFRQYGQPHVNKYNHRNIL